MAEYPLTSAFSGAITVPVGASIQNWGAHQIRVTSDTTPTNDANTMRIDPGKAYKNTGTGALTVRARSMGDNGLLGVITGL